MRNAILKRVSFGTFVSCLMFTMACTSYGQCGVDGTCNHPWDGKPGSCPKPDGITGEIGGGCDSWPSPACQAGGKCLDGTCLSCGGDGELCCDQYSPNPTPCPNGTCQDQGDNRVCNNHCGLLSAPNNHCCQGEGQGCSEGMCNIDTQLCEEPNADPCTGANPYFVYFKDQAGCAMGPFRFSSDNDTDAKACADSMMAHYQATSECGLNQDVHETTVCETSLNGSFPDEVDVCDPADFDSCKQSKCTNCTIDTGDCP